MLGQSRRDCQFPFAFAHLPLCAAATPARPSELIVRRFGPLLAPPMLPVPPSIALAFSSLAISASGCLESSSGFMPGIIFCVVKAAMPEGPSAASSVSASVRGSWWEVAGAGLVAQHDPFRPRGGAPYRYSPSIFATSATHKDVSASKDSLRSVVATSSQPFALRMGTIATTVVTYATITRLSVAPLSAAGLVFT